MITTIRLLFRNMASKLLGGGSMACNSPRMLPNVCAGERPVNSALEVDLDFERSVRPPPQPTEETTRTLEYPPPSIAMLGRHLSEAQTQAD